jgi:hypothetical protein
MYLLQYNIYSYSSYVTKPGLSPGFVMHKGIPTAIVRIRHKKIVRQYILVVLEY